MPWKNALLALVPALLVLGWAEYRIRRASDMAAIALQAAVAERQALLSQVQSLQGQVQALGAHHVLPPVAADPETGELVPVLAEDSTVSCAHQALSGVHTAQRAFDAAFDRFGSLEEIGFSLGTEGGCHRHLAVAVVEHLDTDFNAQAVITRGDGRGRRFRIRPEGHVEEQLRLDDAKLEAWLTRNRWIGAAR